MISGWMLPTAALIGAIAGAILADNVWQAKWDKAESDAATAQLKAIDAAVLQYRNRILSLETISRDTTEKLRTAQADAVIADNTSAGLQQQIDDYVRQPSESSCSATTTAERAAVATKQLVLAELLKRADNRAGSLAKIADESRIRGLACEAAYANVVDRSDK